MTDDDQTMITGADLRRARQVLGWRISDVADAVSKAAGADIARATVADWEARSGVPKRRTAAVRQALGGALDYTEMDMGSVDWSTARLVPGAVDGGGANHASKSDFLLTGPDAVEQAGGIPTRPELAGADLRRARLLRGLDRAGVAELLGISERSAAAWEADGVPVRKVAFVCAEFDAELAVLRGQALPGADLTRVPLDELLAEVARRAGGSESAAAAESTTRSAR